MWHQEFGLQGQQVLSPLSSRALAFSRPCLRAVLLKTMPGGPSVDKVA